MKTTEANGATIAGWRGLSAGDWRGAREAFESALKAGETAEALEGLSWAAWWQDDAATVFDAREGAYRLYGTAGDAGGAARMATWLAIDHLDFHGALAVANGWVRRAHRLLTPLAPGPDHGWLAFLEGYLAFAGGEPDKAREFARRTTALGRRFAVPDLQMLGLALEGAALVACARVSEGMICLDEATAMAMQGEAKIPIAGAWACCFLVSACTAVRDYERASEWCDRIAEFAKHYGSRYMLAFCRAEYAAVQLWRGRWAEAEALLIDSIEDFRRSRPAMVGNPLATLAELRRRQGRHDEAADLLDQLGPTTSAQLARGRLALDRGDAVLAAELAERSLRQLPANQKLSHISALELLVRALITRGELEPARTAVDALREIGGRAGTRPLRASADVCEGMLAAAHGTHVRARPLLEDAIDGYERSGAVFEAAEARVQLAISLAALGRSGPARGEARAAAERLSALGAKCAAERARRVLDACRPAAGRFAPAPLTRRELDVLRLVAGGRTNHQIAERLVVSEHTVHRHVTNILRKLELPSRTAAAAWAARSGLLDPIE